jgi:hypothetical protein
MLRAISRKCKEGGMKDLIPSFPPATEFPRAASALAAIFREFSGKGRVGGMNDKLHSLQTATENPCLKFTKPTMTSGRFGDLKSRWNQ